MGSVATLDSLLAARTLWHAGRQARLAGDGEPTGHAALDALLPQGGWPRRALTELLLPADGVGELTLLLPTLAHCTQAGEEVAVVAPPYVPYAPAWQAAGVDLSRLQVIDAAPRDALWAFEQCLRSGACAAVLGWPLHADPRALRRLQVAADSGQCLGFVLRERRHAANPSPAALRLEAVRDTHGIAWQVRKCRGGAVPAKRFMPGALERVERGVPIASIESSALRKRPHPPSASPPSRGQALPPASGRREGRKPAPFPAGVASPNQASAPSPALAAGESGTRAMRLLPPLPLAGEVGGGRVAMQEAGAVASAPSSACGGGPGWGQAGSDAAARAPHAASAFDTIPCEDGKEGRQAGRLVSFPFPHARHRETHGTGTAAGFQHELDFIPGAAPLPRA